MQRYNNNTINLSIIIPYYNALKYIQELYKVLEPQITEDIEVIIVDDGCQEKELDKLNAKIIHLEKNSGGASKPRNIGLQEAKGRYIAFIDADDMITPDYIYHIKSKISRNPDIIYISWKSSQHNIVIDKKPPNWNCAVWCRVYKREIIGDIRFREDLKIAEDWEFNKRIKPRTSKVIKNQIYIYNIRIGSLTGRKEI